MSHSKESFYILHKKDGDPYSVWSHFLISKNNDTAQCKKCPSILKILGGSTSGLHTHLSTKHNMKVTKRPSSSSAQRHEEPPSKRKCSSVEDFLVKTDTLDDVLARMTAVDGFPFSVFVTSKDLKALLLSKGYTDLPKAASTVRNRVVNYGAKIKQEIKAEITALKNEGERFSISFDEWTSSSNKRYMNVNVHSQKKFWSLGLIRIAVSLNAEVCVDTLKQRLSQFDISLDTDIVAIVTDGPNVMLKVGKLVDAEHHVCFAHGIHLAVCDFLYKKNVTETLPNSIDSDSDDDGEDLESGIVIENGNENAVELTTELNIKEVIKKVRKVVLIFKRSSLKNDTTLQKYVRLEHGKELSLLLDCKTRWNSLYVMLERFAFLKISIQKALLDLGNPVHLAESDFNLINELTKVLAPAKLTVEALCRLDANLCTADAAIKFLFKQLNENDSELASKLKTLLIERIKGRRRKELSGVLSYLQNPQSENVNLDVDVELNDLFSSPSKLVIKKQIVSLIERLNNKGDSQGAQNDAENEETTTIQHNINLTLKEKLQHEIEKSMKALSPAESYKETSEISKIVKQEMNLFEAGSTRGYNLEKVYKYLMTVPPTSIEPERAFSAASYMCNKLRTRLGDETIDTLLFLRSYFHNK